VPERLCELGYPGPLRDRLVDAVLRGQKTATSSRLEDWRADGEPLPYAGERQTVIDSAGQPVAAVEIVGVEVIRCGDADMQLALDEGEGFDSVADWRQAHDEFWNGEVDDDTPIVVERFRLVERL
jgi:uncharacterized protein YhfF